MVGLYSKLRQLKPDIVQTTAILGWTALDAAAAKLVFKYRLFTGSHYHASVFPLAKSQAKPWDPQLLHCRLTRTAPGALVSVVTEKCYAITQDCADVAVRFFGLPAKKVEICPLGVDTELFQPLRSRNDYESRRNVRQRLGFEESDVVCVYSGRFTEDKNPLLLAKAIGRLRLQRERYRGLFIGDGVQASAIQQIVGCTVHPFVRVQDLKSLFHAGDIAVWPTQETTSMLDATGCGLPIIVNDSIVANERVEGNGLKYRLNDLDDLVRALLELKDQEKRRQLGSLGAAKVAAEFSWDAIARRRLRDYEASVHPKRKRTEEVTCDHLGQNSSIGSLVNRGSN